MKTITLNGIAATVRLYRTTDYLPNEQEVKQFEEALGFNLPADYRAFLLQYNGGTCEPKNVIQPVSRLLCDLFGLFPPHFDAGHIMRLQLPASEYLTDYGARYRTTCCPLVRLTVAI